jgi:hypothetical protein
MPQSLVATGEDGASVWVADLTQGIAQRKPVEIGRGATEDGLVEVISGLLPTDKLIVGGRESLVEGTRVRVTGEDRTLSSGTGNPQSSHPAARTALAPGSDS